MSKGEASKTARQADQLNEEVAPTLRSWSSGGLTSEKASTICKAINQLPDWVDEDGRSAAQAHLLEFAPAFSCGDLKRLANHILEVIGPDGAEEHLGRKLDDEEKKAFRKTELSFTNAGEGLTRLRGLLPDVQAGILKAALEGLASPRRNSPTIFDRDGEHSDAATGPLTHPMRLGRAFCELIDSPEHFVQGGAPTCRPMPCHSTVAWPRA